MAEFGDVEIPPEIRENFGPFAKKLNEELGMTDEQKKAAMDRGMKI